MRIVIDTAKIGRAITRVWRSVVPGVCGGYFDGVDLRWCGERAEHCPGLCFACFVAQHNASGT